MAEITFEQAVDIKRTVTVIFDHDNRPEINKDGKTFSVASARLEYRFRSGKWQNPWNITVARRQQVKDGSWGKEVWVTEYQDRALITELANEYRPTAIITITEESN